MSASNKIEYLKGDKVLWIVIILLSLISVLPVYSASSNLDHVNTGSTTTHVLKHILFIFVGLCLMRVVIMVRYQLIGKLSLMILIFLILLLFLTVMIGSTIDGASASRWLYIPGTQVGFQPSASAYLFLIVYLCRYLGIKREKEPSTVENIFQVLVPVFVVMVLVGKDNGSTALMIFTTSMVVLFIGKFPTKLIIGFIVSMVILVSIFITIALTTNLIKANRVHTWKSRIENYMGPNKAEQVDSDEDKVKNYQSMQARAAIVHGGLTGMGPGKSALKVMLPQSSSDFIFAIIVEEYGLFGASVLLILYTIIFVRIIITVHNTPLLFGALMIISLGFMLFLQIFINIAVAVNIIPVTGQPLPLMSYGGTAILITYIQLGLILNVSSRVQTLNEEGIGNRKTGLQDIQDIA